MRICYELWQVSETPGWNGKRYLTTIPKDDGYEQVGGEKLAGTLDQIAGYLLGKNSRWCQITADMKPDVSGRLCVGIEGEKGFSVQSIGDKIEMSRKGCLLYVLVNAKRSKCRWVVAIPEDEEERKVRLRLEALELNEAGMSMDDIVQLFHNRDEFVLFGEILYWLLTYGNSTALHAYQCGIMDCVERIIAGSGGRISLAAIHKAMTSEFHADVCPTRMYVNSWAIAIEESRRIVESWAGDKTWTKPMSQR